MTHRIPHRVMREMPPAFAIRSELIQQPQDIRRLQPKTHANRLNPDAVDRHLPNLISHVRARGSSRYIFITSYFFFLWYVAWYVRWYIWWYVHLYNSLIITVVKWLYLRYVRWYIRWNIDNSYYRRLFIPGSDYHFASFQIKKIAPDLTPCPIPSHCQIPFGYCAFILDDFMLRTSTHYRFFLV